ncbi:undecaprenyl/decaprenyl-phosphate alpha-N-acetylglucosaminyl 1-phosphate transferase [Planctomycetales bacterium ZRK34]|nr:undecaprenyl/decaprenyl-phosphate alpha-N-acetylglucosaminyl 1-phosphate transferase [Planctomycetales bacterium ZRK34]
MGASNADNLLYFSLDQVLSPYVYVFTGAWLMAFVMTPIMRRLALRNGIVDWPDLARKHHREPVAYLGGVAVFLGWAAGVMISFNTVPHSSTPELTLGAVHFPISIIFGALLIAIVGLFDDVYGVSPRVKVGGQLIAAAMLAGQTVGTNLASGLFTSIGETWGFDPTMIPGFDQIVYWLGALIVVVFVLGGCNAANLLDGLDGLAGGVTGIVAAGLTFIAVALAMGLYGTDGAYSPFEMDPVRVVTCLALLGAVLGFLPYNFHPANIFMGDTGSMLLGYLCVSTILLFAEKGDSRLVMAAMIVFAVPIIDTAMAIIRRKSKGQPIFSPDNYHLHHQLVRAGFSVRQSVVLLYILAMGFAVLGSLLIFIRLRYVASVFLVVLGFIVVITYKVGHRQHQTELARKAEESAESKPEPQPQSAPEPASDHRSDVTAT